MVHCRSLEQARAKATFVSEFRPPSVLVVLASLLAALASALSVDPETTLRDTHSQRIEPLPESDIISPASPSSVHSIDASLEHHLQLLVKYHAADDNSHDTAASALPFSSSNDAVAATATPASGSIRRLHAGGLWSHLLDRVDEAQSRVFRVDPRALRARLSSNVSDNEDMLGALNLSRADLFLSPWTSPNASSLAFPTVPRESHLASRVTPTPSHSAQQNRESEPSSKPILSVQSKSTQDSGSSNTVTAFTPSTSTPTSSSTPSTSSPLPLFLSPPLARPASTASASVNPLDLQPLLLQGVTPTPKPPVTPLPPDVLGNHSVYLVGEKCFGIVKLTGTPLRCTPTFVCDYPLCACGFEIIANGAGVIFSMGSMTCICECVWSVAFIISVMVLPSMLFVFGTIMCCCTNKRCPFHREFLDMRRVLCPWWKIVEENKMRDTVRLRSQSRRVSTDLTLHLFLKSSVLILIYRVIVIYLAIFCVYHLFFQMPCSHIHPPPPFLASRSSASTNSSCRPKTRPTS